MVGMARQCGTHSVGGGPGTGGSASLRMKSEARNTKSETNSKHESTKTETRPLGTGLAWDFGFWSLRFVSTFDIRISDLTPYYSHFDGLGSVIALTNSAGSVVNLYEYSVFGEVSASDPNHPNRFLFTGREFDADTGLYYYRARYYNPYLGRFLQTDPAADGMNWYAYCGNDPVGSIDPSGASRIEFRRYYPPEYPIEQDYYIVETWKVNDDGTDEYICGGGSIMATFVAEGVRRGFPGCLDEDWMRAQPGCKLSRGDPYVFWGIQAIRALDKSGFIDYMLLELEKRDPPYLPIIVSEIGSDVEYDSYRNIAQWDPYDTGTSGDPAQGTGWFVCPALANLAHEIAHAFDDYVLRGNVTNLNEPWPYGRAATECIAMTAENVIRWALFMVDPSCRNVYPRPGYNWEAPYTYRNPPGSSAAEAWASWDGLAHYTDPGTGMEIY
jgi:RHS repeat-associated protein